MTSKQKTGEEPKSELLIPLGKMKGEIEDEFEAFYLAVDRNGKLFINRNMEHSKNAYVKSNHWLEITRKQLEYYAHHIHLLPCIKQKYLRQ